MVFHDASELGPDTDCDSSGVLDECESLTDCDPTVSQMSAKDLACPTICSKTPLLWT